MLRGDVCSGELLMDFGWSRTSLDLGLHLVGWYWLGRGTAREADAELFVILPHYFLGVLTLSLTRERSLSLLPRSHRGQWAFIAIDCHGRPAGFGLQAKGVNPPRKTRHRLLACAAAR